MMMMILYYDNNNLSLTLFLSEQQQVKVDKECFFIPTTSSERLPMTFFRSLKNSGAVTKRNSICVSLTFARRR
jgi:hypothetical protein